MFELYITRFLQVITLGLLGFCWYKAYVAFTLHQYGFTGTYLCLSFSCFMLLLMSRIIVKMDKEMIERKNGTSSY
jgi:hypothetical protein